MDGTSARIRSIDGRAITAVGVSLLLWATAFVAVRSAGEHFSPGALALGRLLPGLVTLLAIWAIRRAGLPPKAAWPGIVAAGLLWFGGYMTLLNWAERVVDAGTAAMIVNVGPILITLLGGWLLREGFPPRLLVGLGVAFAGAIVVGIGTSDGGRASTIGVVAALLAAVSYAGGVVAQKPALRHGSPLQVTTFSCLIGTVACLPFGGQLIEQVGRAPLSATAYLLYLGVFPTAVAFLTWAYALARSTAGKLGATTYAVPAIVVVLSWLLLGEVPGLLTLGGGLLCLLGVGVSRIRPRNRTVVSEVSGASRT